MESLAETKVCKKCGAERPVGEFRVRVKDGHRYMERQCLECRREYNRIQSKKHTANNQEKIRAKYRAKKHHFRLNHLSRKYNLTQQSLDELIARQEGMCAICGERLDSLSRPYHIDHCHSTNVVRGILCLNCNVGLGNFKDDPTRLESALSYLAAHAKDKQ